MRAGLQGELVVEDDREKVLGDVSETLLVASGPGIRIPEPQEAAKRRNRG